MKNEIILYQTKEFPAHLEVRVEDETVWLNRQQISTLFERDVKTIGKHINNVFSENELEKSSTVANFATVEQELVSAFFAPTTQCIAINEKLI